MQQVLDRLFYYDILGKQADKWVKTSRSSLKPAPHKSPSRKTLMRAPHECSPSKTLITLKKLIKNDEIFFVFLKQANIVISVGLYNTAVYGSECQEMKLIETIVLSEGLFFWKE